jgi:hypothetical protein
MPRRACPAGPAIQRYPATDKQRAIRTRYEARVCIVETRTKVTSGVCRDAVRSDLKKDGASSRQEHRCLLRVFGSA